MSIDPLVVLSAISREIYFCFWMPELNKFIEIAVGVMDVSSRKETLLIDQILLFYCH
jgi:hypothetical protein